MSRIVIGTSDGKQFVLPPDAVTSTLVGYGGKGMGKTNFGSVLVEELSRAGLRWVAADPLGVWWGLRHDREGKGPGIECVILGGVHGDIPIEPTGGAVVADLVVDEPGNVIIDFSRKPSGEMWSIGEKVRFLTEYAKRLFQRQGSLLNGCRREPFLQILDEAARYIPQVIPHGAAQLAECVGAWETIGEEGRNVGIGVFFLTQRSARMNKSVSEIADAMFSFRIVGPNSIKAVTDWLGEHVAKSDIGKYIEILRSLDRGKCLVVSPGWLQFEGIVEIRARETFDSSATPKPGERPKRVSGEAAKPDLAKYAERMKETIERAKASDPKELQRQLAQLRKELAAKTTATAVATTTKAGPEKPHKAELRRLKTAVGEAMKLIVKINAKGFEGENVDRDAITAAIEKATQEITGRVERAMESRQKDFARLQTEATRTLEKLKALLDGEELELGVEVVRQSSVAINPIPAARKPQAPKVNANGNGDLSGPERKILTALSELRSIGKEMPPKTMVAAWSSYSPQGGAFGNPMGSLSSRGYVEYPQPGFVVLTEAGRSAIGDIEPPDQNEIWQRIERTCTGPERKILRALIDNAGPGEIAKNELAEKSGYSPQGGAFGNPIGALRTKGLLDYPRQGMVRAADWLFI